MAEYVADPSNVNKPDDSDFAGQAMPREIRSMKGEIIRLIGELIDAAEASEVLMEAEIQQFLEDMELRIDNAAALITSKITSHVGDKNNPHEVTAQQVGLEKVKNFGLINSLIAIKAEDKYVTSNVLDEIGAEIYSYNLVIQDEAYWNHEYKFNLPRVKNGLFDLNTVKGIKGAYEKAKEVADLLPKFQQVYDGITKYPMSDHYVKYQFPWIEMNLFGKGSVANTTVWRNYIKNIQYRRAESLGLMNYSSFNSSTIPFVSTQSHATFTETFSENLGGGYVIFRGSRTKEYTAVNGTYTGYWSGQTPQAGWRVHATNWYANSNIGRECYLYKYKGAITGGELAPRDALVNIGAHLKRNVLEAFDSGGYKIENPANATQLPAIDWDNI